MDTSSEDEEEEIGEAPRFTTPLKPQHATMGKEVHLECVVIAKPAPEVQWFKGEKEVGKPTPTSREKASYNPKTGVATLDISEVNEEDLTIFKVRAVNKFGRAECRANIVESYAPVVETTQMLMAPKITKPLEAILVRARETVVLEAKFEGKPMPSIKWYRNGKEIHPGRSQIKVVVEEGVTKLEIPEIFKEDGGKYEVRAMNEVGEARCSGTVAVTEPQTEEMAEVKPPRFIKQLQPQMVPEGDVVIMEAQVDSHPTSSFQWFLHSAPVQSSHDMRITTEGNKSIMVIDEALSEHAGHVTVRAENVAGSVTSMATLAILPEHITETVEEFAAPLFPTPLQATLRVMDGEEVCLTCKVTGKPIPKVMWFHNGKPVKEGKEVTIYQDTEGVCKLAIAEVFPEDAGQYTCRAMNRIGETVCATSLAVEAYEYIPDSEIATATVGTSLTTGHSGSEEDLLAEKETLSEVSEEDADLPDSEVGTAPLFTTKLPSVFYATEKEMARLETKVTGEPKPKVCWYKKGKKIKPTKAMQIENMEDGTSVLTISEVTPEDAGPILCEGQNRLGMDTTTTEVIVEEHLESKSYKKPEWVSKMEEMKKKLQATKSTPTFIREVRDERAKELETVTFECQFSGNPIPDVVWYHDDKVVKNTKNIKIRIKDKKTTLTIYEVTQEHEGSYICKATNELGTIASKGNLYVTGLTEEERHQIELKKAPKEKPKKVEEETKEAKKVEEVVRKTHMEKKKSVTQEFTEQITQEVTQQVSQHISHISEEVIRKEIPKEEEVNEVEEIEKVVKKTHKEKQRKVEAIHRATPIDVPSEEVEEVAPSKPEMVRPTLSQDLVENAYVEEVMQWVAAKEFGPGESPLRDLARIGFLTRHGTSVSEVTSMYETGEFPALRTPEAQIAMVQVVERIGHGAVISEVLSEETTMDTSVEETGFRAFMRMAEQHQVNVEEAIFSFQPEDFRIQAWETTEGELHTAESSEVHVKEMRTKHKKRVTMKTEMEEQEDATLHITQETVVFEDDEKETIVTEIREGDMLFAICSYVAENEEALNLVEGERMYVLECHNSDWWFVKKHLTEEKGWVPAQFLKDEASYTLYVQKKLNEKIDKLPVLEKPSTEEPVSAPCFVEKVQPKHVPDGSTVQFECKVEGNPRPLITWFRQTAIIKPSPDFQMFYDEDNVATLVVREVFPEDAGMFTCVAKNAAGFASSTAELIVEAPLSDHGSDIAGPPSRKSLSRESSLADILEGIPPTFSQKPKAHVVDEKSDVTLECRLVAVPEPTVTWLFEGKEIVEKESKISVSTVSDMHMYTSTLKIHKVKKSQEGTYEIKAINREGEATVSIVLKVRTGAKEPPNILEPLHGTIVEEGGSVVLSTTIVGNPYPRITWLKDGKKISPKEGDTNLKICKDEKSGINTLTIHNAQKTDAGEYSVKAENAAGKATTLASLAVEGSFFYIQSMLSTSA